MLHQFKVRDWMSRPIISVSPETSVNEAYQIMREHHIRRLPVIQGGEVVGIVTVGDIREALPSDASTLDKWEMGYLLDQLAVERIMSQNVLTIGLDDTVAAAAKLLMEHKIGGLPVINQLGMPIGVLSESDIFRLVIQLSNEEAVSRTA